MKKVISNLKSFKKEGKELHLKMQFLYDRLYYSVLIQYHFPNYFGAMTMNEKLTNDSNHTFILEYTPFWVISLLALQSRP